MTSTLTSGCMFEPRRGEFARNWSGKVRARSRKRSGSQELYLPPIAACIEISIKTCVKLLDDNAPTPSG